MRGTQITAQRGGKERKRNQAKMKVVRQRPAHLQPQRSEWEQVEDSDSDSDVDIQLYPVSFPQHQEGQVHEDPAQEPELDAVVPGGGEDQQQIVEGDVRKSGRTRRAPERFGDVLPVQEEREQLSPRNRKRIKSLAARKVPREEWNIRQSKNNLVMIFKKKPQQNTG